ncbi:gp82 [Mycobacterium phage Konstantine]|uniref:RuvC-like resolvase n=1 Tax=Mycobacterium phage Konstantine TaxID=563121 RepID=B5U4V7_9CAUD|nr:gp82 [Mycobacterium phage Konstantine]ACI12498.1 hypothetical protein KONSTANTINE_82 [Mycobacterium phage Konstantine]
MNLDGEVTVLAFDPGGQTGWAAITIPKVALIGAVAGYYGKPPLTTADPEGSFLKAGPLHREIIDFDCGQIDCGVGGVGHELSVGRGHGDLNMTGEGDGVFKMLELANRTYPESAVILEEFTLERNNKHVDLLYPVRVMSEFSFGLQMIYRDEGEPIHRAVERIFINRRVDAKTVVKDDRLREWGLYRRDSGPHARDATRHAYHFLRRCRGSDIKARELRWRAWPDVFEDPAITQKPKRAKKLGERIEFLK